MDVNLGLDQDLINAVSQIVEASCSSKKMEKEELHPNQVKLDKNKNGKLDADDFKKLRKEESEEVEEGMEEFAKSQAKKRAEARKAKEKMSEELNLEDYTLEEIEEFMMSEDFEQLDELSKTTLGSYVKKAASSLSKASHDLGDKRAQSAEVERFTNRHMGDKFRAQGKMKDDLGVGNTAQAKDVHTIIKRNKGITSAANKLTKEQVEEIEALAAKHGLGE
jgi:hypothetical protein